MKLKTFRIVLINCLIAISLIFSGTACAQDEELPDPGITPESPFYFIDTFGKNVGLFFTFGAEAKARKALQYAEERLAEARTMAARNRAKEVKLAVAGYDKFLAIVVEKAGQTGQQAVSDNASERVALATTKHLSVLDRVRDTAPEDTREAITQVKKVSIKGRKNALLALARQRPIRAVEINLTTIKDRLNRARVKANENNSVEVENVINETGELIKFGEEISEIARGLDKDTAAVEQLIARATPVHIEVLAEVYEKVPQQARLAIESVMANSVMNYDRRIEALKEKNIIGKVPEKALLQERVTQKVRERVSNLKPVVRKLQVSEKKIEERDRDSERKRLNLRYRGPGPTPLNKKP